MNDDGIAPDVMGIVYAKQMYGKVGVMIVYSRAED